MSGTSMDGADAALVDFSGQTAETWQVLGTHGLAFSPDLRAQFMALNETGDNELHRAQLAGNALARHYAQAIHTLLAQAGIGPEQVAAIGAHGQTVRHRPQQFDATGYTIQLNNPALLAELTGIDVVADLRSRDVAAGGQGAPVAPFFHRAWFGQTGQTLGVINIGGISNLTVLRSDGSTLGFDCGPGNALMDLWCEQHTGTAFDAGGAFAATGYVQPALLASMRLEPFFAQAWPKSTGRDLFNRTWLGQHLIGSTATAPDVQRTLLELTASALGDCIERYTIYSKESIDKIIICGGGAFNHTLMQRLQTLLAPIPVSSSAAHGLPPQDVEAAAFAWLARECVYRRALPLNAVTGAIGDRVLGAIYPR